jgi:autotransporter translocation and assembly factor TamB
MSGNVLTVADQDGVALSAEALSVRQRKAALLLGRGYSQQDAAEAVDVDVRTIRRWSDSEHFEALIAHSASTAFQRVEPGLFSLLDMAVDVGKAMLRGELAADDKRVLAAERLIDRLTARLYNVGSRASSDVYPSIDGDVRPALREGHVPERPADIIDA